MPLLLLAFRVGLSFAGVKVCIVVTVTIFIIILVRLLLFIIALILQSLACKLSSQFKLHIKIMIPTHTCKEENGPGHNSFPDVVTDLEISCQQSLGRTKLVF